MSHRTTVKTRFCDLQCLAKASTKVEAKLSVYSEPKELKYGRIKDRMALADIKPKGWVYTGQVDNEGELHCDSDDLHARGHNSLQELEQAYQEEVVSDWCEYQGYRQQSRTNEQGELVLEYVR